MSTIGISAAAARSVAGVARPPALEGAGIFAGVTDAAAPERLVEVIGDLGDHLSELEAIEQILGDCFHTHGGTEDVPGDRAGRVRVAGMVDRQQQTIAEVRSCGTRQEPESRCLGRYIAAFGPGTAAADVRALERLTSARQ